MLTLQLTNSTNSTSTTGVFFAGVSPIDYTMRWNQYQRGNYPNEKNTFFLGLLDLRGELTYYYVDWHASLPIRKPKRHISSELASIKAELVKRRAAGAFDKNKSLANRFAKPGVSYTDEEIQATLREIRSQWEQDLDDISGPA